jgi:hypothetical protein
MEPFSAVLYVASFLWKEKTDMVIAGKYGIRENLDGELQLFFHLQTSTIQIGFYSGISPHNRINRLLLVPEKGAILTHQKRETV